MVRTITDDEIALMKKQMKAVKILNNAIYFNDSSDYETALWQAMSALTGIDYSESQPSDLTFLEEQF